MTEPKWTPGTWTVEHEQTWPFGISIAPDILHMTRIAYSSADKTLTDVRAAKSFGYDERGGIAALIAQQEANADLMSAAKDMYEALENLLGAFDTPIGRRKMPGDFSKEAIESAHAAMAKARGEQ